MCSWCIDLQKISVLKSVLNDVDKVIFAVFFKKYFHSSWWNLDSFSLFFFIFAALHFCSHLLLIVVSVLCPECTCFIPSSWTFLKLLLSSDEIWRWDEIRRWALGSSAEACTAAYIFVGYPESRLYLIHLCCRSQRTQVKRSRLGNVCIWNMEQQGYYNCPMHCVQYVRMSIYFLVH